VRGFGRFRIKLRRPNPLILSFSPNSASKTRVNALIGRRDAACTFRLRRTVAPASCCALFLLFQERNDDGDSLLRLFLHDPVARIADDRTANIGGGKADFRC
jgi:hypothetical protein